MGQKMGDFEVIPALRKVIKSSVFPDYTGRKFRGVVQESCFLNNFCEGGTFHQYALLNMETGEATRSIFLDAEAGDSSAKFKLPAGWALIEWDFFCGKDMGITVHIAALPTLEAK
jgi:hypothetical protein